MIRQPIPRSWRIGLGIASAWLLILGYMALSQSRQQAARRHQQQVAEEKLADLETQRARLATRRAEADKSLDAPQREQALARLESEKLALDKQLAQWSELRDHPDAIDLTIPTWSVLWRQGLVRASTPQGSFKRKETWLLVDFKATALRLVTALLVGVLASVTLGMLMGCYEPIESLCLPPLALFSKVPTTAVLPIFFVLVQINFKMYLALIAFGMLPTLAQSISASVRKDVPEELIFKAYTLGASQFELIWEVILRQIMPRILDAARLQIGPSLVLLVAAEWMVAGEGIGYRLRLFYQRTDMTVVFVYVLILGVVGMAVEYGLIWLRRKLCPWFGE